MIANVSALSCSRVLDCVSTLVCITSATSQDIFRDSEVQELDCNFSPHILSLASQDALEVMSVTYLLTY